MTRGLATRRPGVDLRGASAAAHGTFGELLQGVLPDGTDFLVTLPITLRSHASFRLQPGGPLQVYPSHKRKAARLARMLLDTVGPDVGGTLLLDSDVPTGKGLSSSSADLVATLRAVGSVLGLDTSPDAAQAWLRPIEPTDAVMYGQIVAFDHCAVRLRDVLGAVPPLTVLAVDEGGQVDTVRFNRRGHPFTARDRDEYADLLVTLGDAVRTGDLAATGAVASRSSELNQRRNPKRTLDAMLRVADAVGALGVVNTHSGTMLGLLLDPTDPDHPARLAEARLACADLPGQVHLYSSQHRPERLDYAL